jgi:hypothetical protein
MSASQIFLLAICLAVLLVGTESRQSSRFREIHAHFSQKKQTTATSHVKTATGGAMSCLSPEGEPVDWFVVYKMPSIRKSKAAGGMTFAYADENGGGILRADTGGVLDEGVLAGEPTEDHLDGASLANLFGEDPVEAGTEPPTDVAMIEKDTKVTVSSQKKKGESQK